MLCVMVSHLFPEEGSNNHHQPDLFCSIPYLHSFKFRGWIWALFSDNWNKPNKYVNVNQIQEFFILYLYMATCHVNAEIGFMLQLSENNVASKHGCCKPSTPKLCHVQTHHCSDHTNLNNHTHSLQGPLVHTPSECVKYTLCVQLLPSLSILWFWHSGFDLVSGLPGIWFLYCQVYAVSWLPDHFLILILSLTYSWD